jgi:hypothetical protein
VDPWTCFDASLDGAVTRVRVNPIESRPKRARSTGCFHGSLVVRIAAIGDVGHSRFGGHLACLDRDHAPERQQRGARQHPAAQFD